MTRRRRLLGMLASLVVLGVGGGVARATVTQVDGTILPVGTAMQAALDGQGEGGAPVATALNAITDASTVPEIFLPNLTTPVSFRDVAEGAGFENSFGYYNVGDDLSNRANLHAVLGCNRARTDYPITAGGVSERAAAAGYVQNAEPGSVATVDFMAELAAGRYKGGFIGFYLITPEGNPSADNCGDYVNGTDGLSLLGRIYYTQSDLNDDGDFVHHLVYPSKRTVNRFYFGFEDLFRGGDNDFEDMATQVTGLSPPCVAQAEVCDGRDNDCDGLVDDLADLVDDDAACTCSGSPLACEGGARQGVCRTGRTACVAGALLCRSSVAPSAELCDGLDNNCNGSVDDATTDTGAACDGSDGDACNEGSVQCVAGARVCSDTTGTNAETCNGADDDCDALVDEGNPGGGAACDGADGDVCQEGTVQCTGGALVCSDATSTTGELCNGVDDDCDGAVDESPSGIGAACSAGVGLCRRNGATVCSAGAVVCGAVEAPPGTESCNAIDDDCDGEVDEGFGVGTPCDGVGACGIGVLECAGSSATRCSTDPGGSASGVAAEICNGLDDDCDGSVDEGLSDLGTCGDDAGECAAGRLRCVGGAPVCRGAVGPSPEVCNGLDDDCDGLRDERTGEPGDRLSGLVDEGAACGSGVGECRTGTEVCTAGTLVCTGARGPAGETCNGLDDDCDGVVDDAPSGLDVPCGFSDVGECALGRTICAGGMVLCNGEIPPVAEVCNGLDDDCDGATDDDPVDVGLPCGSTLGTCVRGTFQCVAGARVCGGGTVGVPEVCNGIDDDCNGTIDDSPSDAGGTCGLEEGVCELGAVRCIAGALQCVGGTSPGLEICNAVDDDCDGAVDEGSLCGGGACVDGVCASSCTEGEFSCPPGFRCDGGFCLEDPCATVTCPASPDGTRNVCAEGACVPLCTTVTCAAPLVCRGTDGNCVENVCTFLPGLCGPDELCRARTCVPDPCLGVTCPAGDFCREGACVGSCANVFCAGDERCRDGACVATGCDGPCGAARVCVETTDTCENDPCALVDCPAGQVCDPFAGGACIEDPCVGVRCAAGELCRLGDCVSAMPMMPDLGAPDAGGPELVLASGGAGCAVSAPAARGDGVAGLAFALLALGGLAVWRRRRWVRVAVLGVAVSAALAVSGCDVDPYCIGRCEETPADGGAPIDAPIPDGGGEDLARPDACVPSVDPTEICDGVDNNCNGRIDEEFDLDIDPRNCGACGVSCALPGAQTECVGGTCALATEPCFPGFHDVDGDTRGPFTASNGCEYRCFASNGGVEACDGLDNDCDGTIDEDTAFATDPANCGACRRVCSFFRATSECSAGTCVFDPTTDCEAGWLDANGEQADGCEYPCTVTNGGVEICDGLDNDCDGPVDEDFALPTSVTDCGRCGRVCSFPNAAPSCTAGVCGFDPMTDCTPGFSDFNGNQLDGCEYPCTLTNGGVEICDGLDNDCNGTVDGATTDAGGSCNRAPGGVAVGVCTDAGTTTCIAARLVCLGAEVPRTETCNGLDDDCDGSVDESPVDVGRVCSSAVGVCTAGLSTCVGGVLGCEREVDASPELCNGLDDDCDGTVDDAPTDATLGTACGSDVGTCMRGTITCDALGVLVCAGELRAAAERCNGLDDDCDGTVDDDPIDDGGSCGVGLGACVEGSQVCVGGALVCVGAIGPVAETCNGVDDDCDGTVDEDGAGGPLSRPCYTGAVGTQGVGLCIGGEQICVAGSFGACGGQTIPVPETCDARDQDCDGATDEGLTQACYTGPLATAGIGACRGGTRSCTGGAFAGACVGEVLPGIESCNGVDDDCDNATDEGASGGALTQSCYDGVAGTAGVGTCVAGTRTCAFGTLGACVGQVVPAVERCGDARDTDCDALGDVAEGCLAAGGEFRLDGGGGGVQTSTEGAFHSYDVRLAYGGATPGTNVYAVWSDLRNGAADVFLRRSTNGGATWQDVQSLTTGATNAAVVPVIAVAFDPALGTDRVVVAWQEVVAGIRQLVVVRSIDAGVNFVAPLSGARMDAGGSIDVFHHDVAVSSDGRRIAVVWEQLATTTLTRDVFIRRSIDFGQNFAAVQRVTVNSGASPQAGRPTTVVTGTNRFVVVWREIRAGRRTFDVFANYADGDASAFVGANEVRLDADTGDTRQSDLPEAVVAGSNVYVAWEDVATGVGGGSDIVFARSTNNAVSWNAERIVDDPAGEVSSSLDVTIDVDPGTASATDDRVFLAWEDTRAGSQIFTARSVDAGASFGAAVRATSSGDAALTGVTRDPALAWAGGDLVVIGYTNDRLGVARAYAAASIDAGATWQVTDPRLDTGAGQTIGPAVVRAVNGALVAWSDFRTGSRVNGDPYVVRVGR
jgi:Notch-like protein